MGGSGTRGCPAQRGGLVGGPGVAVEAPVRSSCEAEADAVPLLVAGQHPWL